jgi:hypothetical protein
VAEAEGDGAVVVDYLLLRSSCSLTTSVWYSPLVASTSCVQQQGILSEQASDAIGSFAARLPCDLISQAKPRKVAILI